MLVAIVTFRGRCRISAISKTKLLVTIVNSFQLLTVAAETRVTSLDVAWILDPLLGFLKFVMAKYFFSQSSKLLLAY